MCYKLWLPLVTVFIVFFIGEKVMSIDTNSSNKEKPLIFLLSDHSETRINVDTGREFIIKIKTNPATGYSWSFQQQPDKDLIQFVDRKPEDEVEDEESERLVGAPEYELWKFRALNFGETAIKLQYHRPWEKDVPPIKTHTVYVTVQ